MAKKIAMTGEVDPQIRFMQTIDKYFADGSVEEDLDKLTPKDRLLVMGKFAEFRWGKKTAEASDMKTEVNSTHELLEAAYKNIKENGMDEEEL